MAKERSGDAVGQVGSLDGEVGVTATSRGCRGLNSDLGLVALTGRKFDRDLPLLGGTRYPAARGHGVIAFTDRDDPFSLDTTQIAGVGPGDERSGGTDRSDGSGDGDLEVV